MTRALVLLAAVSYVVLAGAGGTTGQQGPTRLKPCAVPGLDVVARCGTVDVTEAAGDPVGKRIAIRVVVVPASAPTPLPDPMLFLAGGPGQGATDLAAVLAARVPSLRVMRDLIFVDQRGTGGSNPLTCPPPPEAADLMGRLFDLSRLAACRDQLARRADLRSYTTSMAAGDYEAVLDALRYGQVNLWGVSYGTRLGLELVRRMPRRVRTLILEGAVPPSMAWPTYGARDADAALSALITDCEADAGCAANYPTFRHDVDAAFARLAPAPVATTVWDPHSRATSQVPFASSDLAYATRGLLYGAEALNLPRLFRAAASGRFDDFAQAYVTRARGLGQGVATGVHLGVYCAEDLPFVDLPAARALAARTRVGSYLLDQYRAACQIWPRATLPQGFHAPVRSDVPTLIMAGRRDPVTPPWTASSVAKALPRGRVLTWEAGGHGFDGLVSPACKQSIVEGFVTSAKADGVTTACMRRDRKLPFLTR